MANLTFYLDYVAVSDLVVMTLRRISPPKQPTKDSRIRNKAVNNRQIYLDYLISHFIINSRKTSVSSL